MDIRHSHRIKIVQEIYACSFSSDQGSRQLDQKTKSVLLHQRAINEIIAKFALKFPINKIARIDLAILQLSVYELIIEKKEPPKVVINEAVELAKELGSEKSYAFINAVLGKIYGEASSTSQSADQTSNVT